MRLFLDDIRHPTDCLTYMAARVDDVGIYGREEWHIVRNFKEFTEFMARNYPNITHVSFDHDLASEHYAPEEHWDGTYNEWAERQNFREMTGADCAKWMKNMYNTGDYPLPTIYIHSMNPVGTENIRRIFNERKI